MAHRRLLFYTHALVGGGAERVMARLAAGFAARGDEVDFVVDYEAQANVATLGDKARLTVLPKGHAASTLALARLLRARRPHASLSALATSNLKHAVAALGAGRRDRAILAYHGFFESEVERLSVLGFRLARPMARLCAATIAVSDSLRADLVARFGVSPARVQTLFNPAAPDPFPPRVSPSDLAARPPTVVSVGRLVPDKDFGLLLEAFAALRTPDARLVILGEGPERQALEARARALGVADRVALPGFAVDIGPALDAARCFALASRRESFGLVCVEALAHGLSCVVTDSGGPREIVDAPEYGAIVPVGAAAALAAALDSALSAPGDPAPRQARAAQFSLDAALDRYDELIARVMRHAGSPS